MPDTVPWLPDVVFVSPEEPGNDGVWEEHNYRRERIWFGHGMAVADHISMQFDDEGEPQAGEHNEADKAPSHTGEQDSDVILQFPLAGSPSSNLTLAEPHIQSTSDDAQSFESTYIRLAADAGSYRGTPDSSQGTSGGGKDGAAASFVIRVRADGRAKVVRFRPSWGVARAVLLRGDEVIREVLEWTDWLDIPADLVVENPADSTSQWRYRSDEELRWHVFSAELGRRDG